MTSSKYVQPKKRRKGWLGLLALRSWLLDVWQNLRTSYWFLPALMLAAAVLASWVFGLLDESFGHALPQWLRITEPDTARSLLSTIATAMMSVAGVTFSIVIVALSIAASQLGPRLVVGFLLDRRNHLALGTFVSVYLYSLLVLRRLEDDSASIPQLSTAFAIALSAFSLLVLVYFFHNISSSVHAEEAVAEAGEQLERAVRRQFPKEEEEEEEGDKELDDDDREPDGWPDAFAEKARPVLAHQTGYLDLVDLESLVELAAERDLHLRLELRDGDFVIFDEPVICVYPGEALGEDQDGGLAEEIRETFHLVRRRGTAEDVQLAVNRLAEIALRGLSPALNDPYTALACIDRFAAGLALVAQRRRPGRTLYDGEGRPRVRLRSPRVAQLVDGFCQQVRIYGRSNPAVLLRLLHAIRLIGGRARDPQLCQALERQAQLLRGAAEDLPEGWEREQVLQAYEKTREALQTPR